jgi:hypothetical protein
MTSLRITAVMREFLGITGGDEALIKRLENRVKARGHEACHIEHAANLHAAPARAAPLKSAPAPSVHSDLLPPFFFSCLPSFP